MCQPITEPHYVLHQVVHVTDLGADHRRVGMRIIGTQNVDVRARADICAQNPKLRLANTCP